MKTKTSKSSANRSSTRGDRFAADIIRLHDTLAFPSLPDAVIGEPLFRFDSESDGLTSLSVRQSQLPDRYLRAVMGFRLAKFLQIGMMDADLARRRALFCEPVSHGAGPETVHALTLTRAGQIVGYMALTGAADPTPTPFDSPRRIPFPAESAHRVDLLSRFAGPGLDSHGVREIKRLVRNPSMPAGRQADRVPWHLIYALGTSAIAMNVRYFVGDAREDGALKHLRLIGFDPLVIDDTKPRLERTELMWPSYENAVVAKPFVSRMPDDLQSYLDVIRTALEQGMDDGWQRSTLLSLRQVARDRGRQAGPVAAGQAINHDEERR